MENNPPKEQLLPKPLTDLPLPEKQIPAPTSEQVVIKNETPEYHGKSPILKFLLLGAIVAIILAAISGAYILGQNKSNHQTTMTIIAPSPSPNPDPTADWQTYSGDYYSFKYPKSWIPYANGQGQGTYSLPKDGQGEYFISPLNDDNAGIHFEVGPTKETSKAVMENAIKNYSWTNKVISNIKIDGVDANKVTGNSNGSENAVVVFGNSIYVYRISSNGREINNFDQILSTFKFTNTISTSPTPNPLTTNWRQYSDTKYSFYFKHPTDWTTQVKDFPEDSQRLINIIKNSSPSVVSLSFTISENSDNMGYAEEDAIDYPIGNTGIVAKKVDPPKKEEQKLERYQTNYIFEKSGNIYFFVCTHNWDKNYINTCENILSTVSFVK